VVGSPGSAGLPRVPRIRRDARRERAWYTRSCAPPAGNVGATPWVAHWVRRSYGRRVGSPWGRGARWHQGDAPRRPYNFCVRRCVAAGTCWHCGCRATHRVAPTPYGNARSGDERARRRPASATRTLPAGPGAVREPPLPGRCGRTRGAMARGRARFARIRTHRGANVAMRAHVHATISGQGSGVPLRGNPLQLDAAAASNSTTVTPAPPSCGPAS
jgi:hypothetical protein